MNIEWRNDHKREHISAAMFTEDNLICCGGVNYRRDVDVYDFIEKKMRKLAYMSNPRRHAGICVVDDYMHKNVYIGGGSESPNTFECYNAEKNKWTSLCNTKNNHKYWPIIWNEDINPDPDHRFSFVYISVYIFVYS